MDTTNYFVYFRPFQVITYGAKGKSFKKFSNFSKKNSKFKRPTGRSKNVGVGNRGLNGSIFHRFHPEQRRKIFLSGPLAKKHKKYISHLGAMSPVGSGSYSLIVMLNSVLPTKKTFLPVGHVVHVQK
jgi:hypothetical protein